MNEEDIQPGMKVATWIPGISFPLEGIVKRIIRDAKGVTVHVDVTDGISEVRVIVAPKDLELWEPKSRTQQRKERNQ